MSHNPWKDDRKNLRLAGWDYTRSGAYFVTLCTHQRISMFGEVVAGRMFLNRWGRLVHEEWCRSEQIRREISLDAFVIMPNHLHGIVVIRRPTSRLHVTWPGTRRDRSIHHQTASVRVEWPLTRKSQSLGSMIAGFKASVTSRINRIRRTPDGNVWQRNYWERVLRSERELRAVRKYIRENPVHWYADRNHPDHW